MYLIKKEPKNLMIFRKPKMDNFDSKKFLNELDTLVTKKLNNTASKNQVDKAVKDFESYMKKPLLKKKILISLIKK